jgi:hypothetical protein
MVKMILDLQQPMKKNTMPLSAEKADTIDEYKARLTEVEKIVVPFLMKLIKTADQPIIKWPNRKPVLEAQVQKILNLTRD